MQLINRKCIPSLLYGLEACPLIKSELSSLDFVVNRFFMKMFRTSNMDVIRQCESYFDFDFLILQVHCGLIALRRLMLNKPPAGAAL